MRPQKNSPPKRIKRPLSDIAIENSPVEIADFSIKNGGFFHSYVNVYQRVLFTIVIFHSYENGDFP